MKCREPLNRYYGDYQTCGEPVVAYVNTAIGKSRELCLSCAEKYAAKNCKVNYYPIKETI